MKRNVIIVLVSILILTGLFVFARTTTTDLGLVKPTWEEEDPEYDILVDLNTNWDILETFANDVLEFDLSPVLRANLDISTFNIEGVDATEFGYLDGVTSDIQTQFDSIGSGAVDTSGTPVDNDIAVFTDLNTIEGLDYSELKIVLDLEIGIDVQAYDATLTDIADGTINENLVNTANPWADDEVSDTLTASDLVAGSSVVSDGEVDNDITIDLATAAEHLLMDAKEENTSAIVIGQPVYQSGATGLAFPKVGLADADVGTKAHVLGLAASAFVMNETGTVMISGVLTGVDSDGATAINPSDQTWQAGEKLYLHTTPGGLTNIEPTVGRVVEIGYILYGESNNDAIVIHIQVTHPHIEVSIDEDIVLRLGDSDGTNKVIIKDYTNTEVAHIDSDGGADFNSLILDAALPIAEGGTSSTSAADARTALDVLQDAANVIDSDHYTDGSIDNEHLAPDIISGLVDVTSEDADYILIWDNTDSALKKVDMGEVRGGNGGATTYLELTDTPGAYDNGKYAKSTTDGVVWDTPAGAGTVTTSGTPVANDIARFTGATVIEGLSYGEFKTALDLEIGTDVLAQQSIGITDDYLLEVDGSPNSTEYARFTANGLEGRTEAEFKGDFNLEIGTDIQAFDDALTSISGLTYASPSFIKLTANDTYAVRTLAETLGDIGALANIVEDTDPDLGGELDAGAHSIGFTLQTDTGTGAKTIDWRLGNKMQFTFGAGDVNFTFTAPTNPCTVMLTLIQDGGGSRTVTWPGTVKWAGGVAPTLTTAGGSRDKVALDWDGSQYDAVASLDFK